MDSMKHRRLQEMDRSDFRIVDGEPDIRGWDVRLPNGQKAGEVEDLIVDAQKKKVRYMIVDRKKNDLELPENTVLVPIGLALLNEKEDDVQLPGITAEQLRSLPPYDANNLNETTERMICNILGRYGQPSQNTAVTGTSATDINEEFYRHDYFNDDNLYKNRLHEATPASNTGSDYERGLRLWEMRSEGGIIGSPPAEQHLDEEQRRQLVNNRRKTYEERRSQAPRRQDNSIEARIKREGLQDAGA